MSILDFFKKKKKILAPWEKYYTEDELNRVIPNISLYEQVRRSANKYPDYKAIEYLGVSITYKELIKRIDKCAISFEILGIKKGDIVTICLPNVPEALVALYALNKLGAIANMLHPLSAEEEIKQSLNSTKSIYLVFLDSFYDKIENIIKDTSVRKVIFVSPSDSLNIFMRIGYKISQFRKYKKYPKEKLFTSWNKFMKLSKNKKEGHYPKYGRNTPAVLVVHLKML